MAKAELSDISKALELLTVLADPSAAKAMLQELHDAALDADEALAEMKKQADKAEALADEARALKDAAEAAKAKEADLALRRADESHALAEKAKELNGSWAELTVRKEALEVRESRLFAAEKELAASLKSAQEKEAALAGLEAMWKEKLTALQQLAAQ